MTQLVLPLGLVGDGAEDDAFLVSEANMAAVQMLDHWATWPVMAALLTGPRKSGRTRLGRIFLGRSNGTLIDDAERQDEAELFHAWNRAQAERKPLLIIADSAPPEWQVTLPDLRSRLTATPKLSISPPDDALVEALFRQQFERRLLLGGEDVLNWLARRTDRSYVAIHRIVEWLDAEAQARHHSRLTIPFVRSVLLPAGLLTGDAEASGDERPQPESREES